MKNGGRRPGAGRKPGVKNKIKLALDDTVARVQRCVQDGLTPLEYLLTVLRTEESPMLRIEAAKAAAPYVHKKQPQDLDITAKGLPASVTIIVPAFGK